MADVEQQQQQQQAGRSALAPLRGTAPGPSQSEHGNKQQHTAVLEAHKPVNTVSQQAHRPRTSSALASPIVLRPRPTTPSANSSPVASTASPRTGRRRATTAAGTITQPSPSTRGVEAVPKRRERSSATASPARANKQSVRAPAGTGSAGNNKRRRTSSVKRKRSSLSATPTLTLDHAPSAPDSDGDDPLLLRGSDELRGWGEGKAWTWGKLLPPTPPARFRSISATPDHSHAPTALFNPPSSSPRQQRASSAAPAFATFEQQSASSSTRQQSPALYGLGIEMPTTAFGYPSAGGDDCGSPRNDCDDRYDDYDYPVNLDGGFLSDSDDEPATTALDKGKGVALPTPPPTQPSQELPVVSSAIPASPMIFALDNRAPVATTSGPRVQTSPEQPQASDMVHGVGVQAPTEAGTSPVSSPRLERTLSSIAIDTAADRSDGLYIPSPRSIASGGASSSPVRAIDADESDAARALSGDQESTGQGIVESSPPQPATSRSVIQLLFDNMGDVTVEMPSPPETGTEVQPTSVEPPQLSFDDDADARASLGEEAALYAGYSSATTSSAPASDLADALAILVPVSQPTTSQTQWRWKTPPTSIERLRATERVSKGRESLAALLPELRVGGELAVRAAPRASPAKRPGNLNDSERGKLEALFKLRSSTLRSINSVPGKGKAVAEPRAASLPAPRAALPPAPPAPAPRAASLPVASGSTSAVTPRRRTFSLRMDEHTQATPEGPAGAGRQGGAESVIEVSSDNVDAAARAAAILKVCHRYIEHGADASAAMEELRSHLNNAESEVSRLNLSPAQSVTGSTISGTPLRRGAAAQHQYTPMGSPLSMINSAARAKRLAEVDADAHDMATWTSRDWRKLERALVDEKRAARAESRVLTVEGIVWCFLENEDLDEDECTDEWAWDKLMTRASALLEGRRRSRMKRTRVSSAGSTSSWRGSPGPSSAIDTEEDELALESTDADDTFSAAPPSLPAFRAPAVLAAPHLAHVRQEVMDAAPELPPRRSSVGRLFSYIGSFVGSPTEQQQHGPDMTQVSKSLKRKASDSDLREAN